MCDALSTGIVQTGIFLTRNAGKTFSGKDTGRIGATASQAVSFTDSVASSSIFGEHVTGFASNILNHADEGIYKAAESLGKTSELTSLTAKMGTKSAAGAIARKAINPLLCVAAGVRILKDEDQYARLIEEGSAMGLMFATEKLMKTQRNNFYNLAGLASGAAPALDTTKGLGKLVASAANKVKGMSSGKQMAVKIGLELLFVAGSIAAYNIGKGIGKKLSHRDERAQARQMQAQQLQPQTA